MAQPQQVVDPNVNPPPTEQQLLEYRVKMDKLTSAFHEEVQVRGVNAYTKLIHELKITVCKYNSDLVEADEQVVLKSIKRHEGQHFKQDGRFCSGLIAQWWYRSQVRLRL